MKYDYMDKEEISLECKECGKIHSNTELERTGGECPLPRSIIRRIQFNKSKDKDDRTRRQH